jgi:hypothetical protein
MLTELKCSCGASLSVAYKDASRGIPLVVSLWLDQHSKCGAKCTCDIVCDIDGLPATRIGKWGCPVHGKVEPT